jgi:uncharacterized protein (TIGR02118 family)
MIKVSVLYPARDDATFDMEYYCERHMSLVQRRLGAACKSVAVEKGVSGGGPGTAPTYIAMGHLYFDSLAAFQTAFTPHASELLADVPNYTNTSPVIQISEVIM